MMKNNALHILKRIRKTILSYAMIEKGDKIVVGLSGGADSVCLLHSLDALSKELDFTLCAAHLNHSLRGEESDRDAEFVVNLCRDMDIELTIQTDDVKALAQRDKISEETAGRNARYSFFNEVKKQVGANKIATAHNQNDNAETLLMHLLRGSGIVGLSGIAPVRPNGVIRPVLELCRDEIESYCQLNHLSYVTDSTNLLPCYHRNKIRLELIEVLKQYNPNVISTLAVGAQMMRQDSAYLEEATQKEANNIITLDPDRVLMKLDDLFPLHQAILSRLIRIGIVHLTKSKLDIPQTGIMRVLDLIRNGKAGQQEDVCGGIVAQRTYDSIVLTKLQKEEAIEFCYPLPLDREVEVNETGHVFLAQLVENKGINSKDCVFFDYNLIKGQIYIRCKKNGDRFRPSGMKGSKKLQDFFSDNKIPAYMRPHIPIVATDSLVLWVCGYRADGDFLVTEQTRKILMIKFWKRQQL